MIYDTDSFLAAGDEADVLGDAIAVRYDRPVDVVLDVEATVI